MRLPRSLRKWFGRRKRPALLITNVRGWMTGAPVPKYLSGRNKNTNCRPDVAPTSGLEHGLTRRDFHNSLEEKDSLIKTPTTTTPAADARLRGSTGTAHE
jgi:hypothetical protein